MRTVKAYTLRTEGDTQLSKNFKVKEFRSRTHPFVIVNYELCEILQQLRDYFNKPINVNSGYRTTSHNTSVGGSYNSAHLIGCAADISMSSVKAEQIAQAAERMFGQKINIGLHTKENYVHIDTVYRGNWYKENLSNKVKTFTPISYPGVK